MPPSNVYTVTDPTQEQLKQADYEVDAFNAMRDALFNCKTPNIKYFTREALSEDFALHVEGLPLADIDGAMKLLLAWNSHALDFGHGQEITEFRYSSDGHKMVCIDRFKLVLTSSMTLPSGKQIDLRPGQKTRTVYLVNYHYLRIVKVDNCYRIAEWRIASQPSDFFQLLDSA